MDMYTQGFHAALSAAGIKVALARPGVLGTGSAPSAIKAPKLPAPPSVTPMKPPAPPAPPKIPTPGRTVSGATSGTSI